MSYEFPTQFSKNLVAANEFLAEINDTEKQRRLVEALEILRRKNLEMMVGASATEIRQIQEIAKLPDIIEYCPKEPTNKRFGDPSEWVSKGRQVFIVRTKDLKEVVDYSWTGWGPCEELGESYPITTAYRATVSGTGKALVAATVVVSSHLYPAGHGLETWASNGRAVSCYLSNGAETVRLVSNNLDGQRIMRPTLIEAEGVSQRPDGTLWTPDSRLYMGYPWTIPNSVA